ncbi:hypothetical protein EVAR_28702_1 [Eumeta japonica]|uniref:Uncharacterized protein n=1 Tax=Eumeta variegata TaxID=151549 RepID=A0A4C1V5L0_EUMVA|nr:hypothetical protein EVAR_28702_1 [Eumeta japonica]
MSFLTRSSKPLASCLEVRLECCHRFSDGGRQAAGAGDSSPTPLDLARLYMQQSRAVIDLAANTETGRLGRQDDTTLTEYVREVTVAAVVFRPGSESSDSPLPLSKIIPTQEGGDSPLFAVRICKKKDCGRIYVSSERIKT